MTEDSPTVVPSPQLVQPFAVSLLSLVAVVQALRLGLAVAGGIAGSVQHEPGGPGIGLLESGAERLLDFSAAGDGIGAVLMLFAVALLRAAAGRRRYVITCWLLALTSLSSMLGAAGYIWEATQADFFPVARVIEYSGFTFLYGIASAGGLYVARRWMSPQAAALVGSGDDPEAAVFAVDRRNGEVLAWSSLQAAREEAPVYGVEDDDYDFFLDDGTFVSAGVDADGRVVLTPTEQERMDDLLAALREHARRTGLHVDPEDADEPLAYVDMISRERWLSMWPGWLRWIGRFVRPPR